MDVEPLWRSRLRWRFRGALLWPAFLVLTLVDAVLLAVLPIGEEGMELFPAALLAAFFNLLAVAVAGPLLALALRRRRWLRMPRIIAEDYTGAAMLVVVTLVFLAVGLARIPARNAAEREMAAQAHAAAAYAREHAPAEYRGGVAQMTTLKEDEDLYRTCVPGPDPKRWFCMYVSTDTSPPGITVDESRESNASLTAHYRYRYR